MIQNKLIVALDFDNVDDAAALANSVKDLVPTFKVGMELAYDPECHQLLDLLKNQGSRIFFDLKLHDIPATIERTVRKITRTGVDMLTVYGYPDTLYAAARGSTDSATEVYGISVLTSYTDENLRAAGYTVTLKSLVGQRTDHVVLSGIAGMVCAVEDVKNVRGWSRNKIKLITPGIRLPGDDRNDQARVATPRDAVKAGADYFVVGRPITRSDDPRGMVEKFLEDAARAAN